MSLTLLVTDIEGEVYEWECEGYERQAITGILKVFIDGTRFIELTPDDYGGGAIALLDWHDLDPEEELMEPVH